MAEGGDGSSDETKPKRRGKGARRKGVLLPPSQLDPTAMGSAASKVSKAKPMPRVPPVPAMPTARTPRPEPMPEVSEAKSQGEHPLYKATEGSPLTRRPTGIVKDGQDPTFMANLSQLGQVHVPHSGITFRTVSFPPVPRQNLRAAHNTFKP